MRFTTPLLLLLLLAACSTPDARQARTTAPTADTASTAEPMDTARAAKVNAQSDTLKTVQRKHLFSSPSTPDVFMLTLRGPNLLSGEASFTITDASGQVIFREVLTAPDLEAAMVYEMQGPSATQTEREAFVKKRIDEFFADENFQQPALAKNEKYQPGQLDRATWDDLHNRADAIGFRYLVGKEETRRIAWSPLKKQVVKLGSTGG
ncbi:hypothetical protein [Hymenobacter crusticola]|uniref:Uncharacterized protein n=1 Tax=Hymenobacter crusticola TaxID=1770526 RepID=A0A243WHZ4_9BACT|nr:hypothetical protein [Hymenobacter crusticola]OUJ75435.1 hypothetical protein BXP70_05325 [Hymenobacter crusticola]